MAQEYCLFEGISCGRRFRFSETNAASFRFLEDFFIIVGVLLVEKNIVLFQRKNGI